MSKRTNWLDRRIAAPGPYFALCLNEEQFHRACTHINCAPPPFMINDWSNASAHCFDTARGLVVIVCMRDWAGKDPIVVAGLLVHEAVHVWQEYAARIGERNPGTEQEAYAIQSISQELMAEFVRLTT